MVPLNLGNKILLIINKMMNYTVSYTHWEYRHSWSLLCKGSQRRWYHPAAGTHDLRSTRRVTLLVTKDPTMPELDFNGKEFVYNHHPAIPPSRTARW